MQPIILGILKIHNSLAKAKTQASRNLHNSQPIVIDRLPNELWLEVLEQCPNPQTQYGLASSSPIFWDSYVRHRAVYLTLSTISEVRGLGLDILAPVTDFPKVFFADDNDECDDEVLDALKLLRAQRRSDKPFKLGLPRSRAVLKRFHTGYARYHGELVLGLTLVDLLVDYALFRLKTD